MRIFDTQVLLHHNSPHYNHLPSLSGSRLGMFPLSLGNDVIPGQIVTVNKKPVPDGFYIDEKNNGQLIPGWKAVVGKNKEMVL